MCKYVQRLETEDTLYLPQKQKQPSFEDCFFRQCSLFCLVITSCNVKGYAAFHKTSTADAVPEVFAHSRLHSRFLLCKNRCCDEPCFAARNRLTAENDRTLIARHRLFSVIFSLFVLAGVSPPASQKEKIPRKFLCGGCVQFLRCGFLS